MQGYYKDLRKGELSFLPRCSELKENNKRFTLPPFLQGNRDKAEREKNETFAAAFLKAKTNRSEIAPKTERKERNASLCVSRGHKSSLSHAVRGLGPAVASQTDKKQDRRHLG